MGTKIMAQTTTAITSIGIATRAKRKAVMVTNETIEITTMVSTTRAPHSSNSISDTVIATVASKGATQTITIMATAT